MFADLASPRTVENLATNPHIEVNVIDLIARKGFRFKGTGKVYRCGEVFERGLKILQERGLTAARDRVRSSVVVDVAAAAAVISPPTTTAHRRTLLSSVGFSTTTTCTVNASPSPEVIPRSATGIAHRICGVRHVMPRRHRHLYRSEPQTAGHYCRCPSGPIARDGLLLRIGAGAVLGRSAARQRKCFGAIEGLVVLEAVIKRAEEFVEQVTVGRCMPIAVFAPLTVVPAGWLVSGGSREGHIQPTLASRLFLICRRVTIRDRPDARVTGADPA